MKYHARIFYPGGSDDITINLSRDQLYHSVITPFFTGQITTVVLPPPKGIQIINMKAARSLALYETQEDLQLEEFYNPHEERVKDCTAQLLGDVPTQWFSQSGDNSYLSYIFSPQKPQAFVIMKYGDRLLDSAYKGVVKPIFKQFGIDARRIDEQEDSGKITDQMLLTIAQSSIVYADLSGERPNCYYELGFAHALGKNVILTINTRDERHFDIAGYRFIEWQTEQDLRERLTSRLEAMLGPKPGT